MSWWALFRILVRLWLPRVISGLSLCVIGLLLAGCQLVVAGDHTVSWCGGHLLRFAAVGVAGGMLTLVGSAVLALTACKGGLATSGYLRPGSRGGVVSSLHDDGLRVALAGEGGDVLVRLDPGPRPQVVPGQRVTLVGLSGQSGDPYRHALPVMLAREVLPGNIADRAEQHLGRAAATAGAINLVLNVLGIAVIAAGLFGLITALTL